MTEPDLELASRRRIYQYLTDNPGENFRGMLDELDYAQGTVQYHLRWLEKEGLIDESDDGKYTRYYPAAEFDQEDQAVMNALRREYSRRILAHLLTDGPLSTTALSDRIGKAQSTVSWHLSNLADADLVMKQRDGRSVVYEVSDPDQVTYLYTIHQQSFTDRVVDKLLGLWDTY
jgi:predicted transcriptional regulator